MSRLKISKGDINMGKLLAGFFEKAKATGGMAAGVKLAMLTRMSQKEALGAADSPENIKKFEAAMASI